MPKNIRNTLSGFDFPLNGSTFINAWWNEWQHVIHEAVSWFVSRALMREAKLYDPTRFESKLRMRKSVRVSKWTSPRGTHDSCPAGSGTLQPWALFYTVWCFCFSLYHRHQTFTVRRLLFFWDTFKSFTCSEATCGCLRPTCCSQQHMCWWSQLFSVMFSNV